MNKLTPQQIHGLKSLRSELAQIPEENWCTGCVMDGKKRCFYGHVAELDGVLNWSGVIGPDGARGNLVQGVLEWSAINGSNPFVSANDGGTHKQHHTPKRRVMAYLAELLGLDGQ